MIKVVGIGPAGSHWMTAEGKEVIQWAHLVVGSPRQIESVEKLIDFSQSRQSYDSLKHLVELLDQYIEFSRKQVQDCEQGISKWTPDIAVLASGDPSFYGIAKYLMGIYGDDQIKVIPGISSIQYLFSRIGKDMNDVYLTSCHGRHANYDRIFNMPKIGMLTDEIHGPYEIAKEALRRGEDPILVIGESLGYPDETIDMLRASQVADRDYGMNVVIMLREEALS